MATSTRSLPKLLGSNMSRPQALARGVSKGSARQHVAHQLPSPGACKNPTPLLSPSGVAFPATPEHFTMMHVEASLRSLAITASPSKDEEKADPWSPAPLSP